MSIYRRGNVYYYDFTLEGKRYAGSTKMRDKSKAVLYEAQLREKLQQELDDARLGRRRKKRYTLKQACERMYEEVWSMNDTGEETVKMVEVIIEIIGNMWIDQISSDDCRTLLKTLRRGGYKPKNAGTGKPMPPLSNARINRYFAALRAILRRAWKEWEVIDGVPPIPKLDEPPGRDVQYTDEEEATILKALEPYPDARDVVLVLLYTGCRLNEVIGMEFGHIRWPKDEKDEYGAIFIPGRARKNEKHLGIPMLPQVEGVLRRRRQQLPPNAKRVFPNISGDRVDKLWAKVVRPALGQEKNRDYVVHGLRHTLASRLIAAGVDLYTVQQILGHSSVIVTQRYAHRNPQRLAKAMSILDPTKPL